MVDGFALQETALLLGGESGGDLTEASEQIVVSLSPGEYAALMRLTMEHVMPPGYNFADSFEQGLDFNRGSTSSSTEWSVPPRRPRNFKSGDGGI